MDNDLQHPGNQADEYVKCPYFPEHELRRSRLPYHLQKCQNNPRAPNLVACPYNFMHRVRIEDREDHLIFCEDRINFKFTDRKPVSYANTLKDHFKINDQKELAELQKDTQQTKIKNTIGSSSQSKNGADDDEWW